MGTEAQALIRKRECMIFNMIYSKRLKVARGAGEQESGVAAAAPESAIAGVERERIRVAEQADPDPARECGIEATEAEAPSFEEQNDELPTFDADLFTGAGAVGVVGVVGEVGVDAGRNLGADGREAIESVPDAPAVKLVEAPAVALAEAPAKAAVEAPAAKGLVCRRSGAGQNYPVKASVKRAVQPAPVQVAVQTPVQERLRGAETTLVVTHANDLRDALRLNVRSMMEAVQEQNAYLQTAQTGSGSACRALELSDAQPAIVMMDIFDEASVGGDHVDMEDIYAGAWIND
jgi:hypothetical protein